jgi:hypothetical protein
LVPDQQKSGDDPGNGRDFRPRPIHREIDLSCAGSLCLYPDAPAERGAAGWGAHQYRTQLLAVMISRRSQASLPGSPLESSVVFT